VRDHGKSQRAVIDHVNDYLFDKPLLLIGEDGANLINRSTPIAFIATGKYWVNNHAHVIDGISLGFLSYLKLFINAISLELYITGTAQPKMNQAKMNSILIAIPPESEQHRIVAKVNELMSLCDALEQEQAANIAAHQTLVEELLAALTSSTPNSPPSLTLPPQGVEGTREKNRDALLLPSPLAGEGLGMGGMPAWARIATHFDTLFTTEHSIDQLKQTILQLAVMGKLVPQDPNDEPASQLLQKIAAEKTRLIKEGKIKKEKPLPAITDNEKPFELPNGWEWCRIGAFTSIGTGATPARSNIDYYHPAEVNWVTSGETSENFIFNVNEKISLKAVEETNISIYPIGTLIIAMYGQGKTRGQITELAIEAGTNQACAAIQLIEQALEHRRFIKLFFQKSYEELRSFSAGGAQPNLNLSKISNTVVSLPPLAEQHRIVAKVDELMALCDAMKAQISAAQATQLQLADALAAQQVM